MAKVMGERDSNGVQGWWHCPNDPPCPHGNVLHDRDDNDDPAPTCCVEGCHCGKAGT